MKIAKKKQRYYLSEEQRLLMYNTMSTYIKANPLPKEFYNFIEMLKGEING